MIVTETTLYYVGGGRRKYMGHGPDARSAVDLAVCLAHDAGHGNIRSMVDLGLGKDYVLVSRPVITNEVVASVEPTEDPDVKRVVVLSYGDDGCGTVIDVLECPRGEAPYWSRRLESKHEATVVKVGDEYMRIDQLTS